RQPSGWPMALPGRGVWRAALLQRHRQRRQDLRLASAHRLRQARGGLVGGGPAAQRLNQPRHNERAWGGWGHAPVPVAGDPAGLAAGRGGAPPELAGQVFPRGTTPGAGEALALLAGTARNLAASFRRHVGPAVAGHQVLRVAAGIAARRLRAPQTLAPST